MIKRLAMSMMAVAVLVVPVCAGEGDAAPTFRPVPAKWLFHAAEPYAHPLPQTKMQALLASFKQQGVKSGNLQSYWLLIDRDVANPKLGLDRVRRFQFMVLVEDLSAGVSMDKRVLSYVIDEQNQAYPVLPHEVWWEG